MAERPVARAADPASQAAADPQVAQDDERRKARLIAAFFDDAARAAADDRTIWQALVERTTEAVGDSAVASLVTDDGEWLEAVGVFHPDPDRAEQIRAAVARRRLDGTMYGDVIRKGSVVFIPTFRPEDRDENLKQMSEEQWKILSRSGVKSVIALPLLLNGHVAGVLAASRTVTPEPYTISDVEVIQALAARAAVVLDNAATHRDLRAAAERFETIIAESPIATVVLDAERRVAMWNAASEELLGWSEGDVIGDPLPTMWLDAATDDPLHVRLTAGETIRGREGRLRRKDGKELPAALYAAPLRQAGEVTGSVLRWVDLSERYRLEAQLLQAQRLESVGRLAGGIAHDFNNILTAILGFARLVREDLPADAPQRANVRAIEEAAERGATLVRQLLAFGRQQVLRTETLDLGEVIRSVTPMLERIIGEDVVLSAPSSGSAWPIEADRGQLEQVVVNLAVNARDAMPHGGRLTIETQNVDLDTTYTETHPEVVPGPHAMLAVSDTGTGMDADTMARIFEPFFTTKEASRGTGLGLATVYGIVKQSGGHTWVYSEPGRGTTFRLYFPRAETVAAGEAIAPPVPFTVTGSETVLVAEDEEVLRALIDLILRRLGYSVLLASNAAQALEIARREPIDLLVTDIVMPGQSGFELAESVRAIAPGVGVLFMSGYTSAALEGNGPAANRRILLHKPFTPTTLAEAIRAALAMRTTVP
jgi:two-component system, cell cycle sensor histidine kinase and response regulator CckA